MVESEEHKRLFCSFEIKGRTYGFDIYDVKEVNDDTRITPIHHSSDGICGLLNLRGQIHLIINLRQLLGFKDAEMGDTSRIVIFKPIIGNALGVLVDKIGEIKKVPVDRIEMKSSDIDITPPEEGAEGFSRALLVKAVCRLDDGLMTVIDPRCLEGLLQKGHREMIASLESA